MSEPWSAEELQALRGFVLDRALSTQLAENDRNLQRVLPLYEHRELPNPNPHSTTRAVSVTARMELDTMFALAFNFLRSRENPAPELEEAAVTMARALPEDASPMLVQSLTDVTVNAPYFEVLRALSSSRLRFAWLRSTRNWDRLLGSVLFSNAEFLPVVDAYAAEFLGTAWLYYRTDGGQIDAAWSYLSLSPDEQRASTKPALFHILDGVESYATTRGAIAADLWYRVHAMRMDAVALARARHEQHERVRARENVHRPTRWGPRT